MPEEVLAASHWAEASRADFAAAWTAEMAELPDYATSTIHMVSGLLLPIWKSLPRESPRVFRLQADDGERVIGRRVTPAWVAKTIGEPAAVLPKEDAWRLLNAGEVILHLAEGQVLKRVRAMNDWRIELAGFDGLGVARLKSLGLISEIVSWKLRLYVPAGAVGVDVFGRLLERFPIQQVSDRKAA